MEFYDHRDRVDEELCTPRGARCLADGQARYLQRALLGCSAVLFIAACNAFDNPEPQPPNPFPTPGFVLDDAEDGNNVTLDNQFGMIGFWYTQDDRCACDNLEPSGDTFPIPFEKYQPVNYAEAGALPAPSKRGTNNKFGFRVSGGGHQQFAGLGVAFNNQSGSLLPFDLSEIGLSGLQFWARSGLGEQEVVVNISDVHSEPGAGRCIRRPEEQETCFHEWDGESCDPDGCMDSPRTVVTLTEEWQRFDLPFTQFRRDGSGSYREPPPSEELDPTQAYNVFFKVLAAPQFDLWFDDVGFMTQDGKEVGAGRR